MNDRRPVVLDDFSEQLLGAMPSALIVCGDSGVIVWNASAERLLGLAAPDVLGRSLTEVGFPELDALAGDLDPAAAVGEALERELLLSLADRTCIAVLASVTLVNTIAGRSVMFSLSNLTHRLADEQRLRAAHHQARLLVENSADMVALLDPTGVITFVNGAITRRAAYDVEELLGRPALELVHPDDVDRVQAALADVVGGERHTCSLTFRFRSRDGGYSWFDGRAVNLVDEPAVGAILVSLHDVTQRVETEEQLAHQATHDPLTGVPNRALFLDRLAHLLEHARRHHRLVAVLFWDIDQFKAVNDRGGHAVGDSLLKEVATCAQATLRGEDTVARVGGDEFLACAVVADQSQVFALAERLHQALMIDVALPKERIHVTASIGVAFGIESAPEQMVVEADHAMYDAKRRGGRGISVVSLDRGAADGTGRVRYLDQPAS